MSQFTRLLMPIALAVACATQPPMSRLADAPIDFVDGTRLLAPVFYVYTRDEVVNASFDPGMTRTWPQELLSLGVTDADITDGSEIYAQTYCWRNSVRTRCGDYMAHVPAELRGRIKVSSEDPSTGQWTYHVVEIELERTPSGKLAGRVVGIDLPSGHPDSGTCRFEMLEASSLLGALLMVAPPTGGWFQCDNLESRGWIERVVEDQPPITPMSGRDRDNYLREFVKPPTR